MPITTAPFEQFAFGEREVEAIEARSGDAGRRRGPSPRLEEMLRVRPARALRDQFAALIVVAERDRPWPSRRRPCEAGRCAGHRRNRPWSRTLPTSSIWARLLVDDRHADALGLQHLRNRLAEASVADDDGTGLGRLLRPVEALARCAPRAVRANRSGASGTASSPSTE